MSGAAGAGGGAPAPVVAAVRRDELDDRAGARAAQDGERDVRTWVREYIRRGWCVLPLPPRSKRCVLDGWPDLKITDADVPSYFGGSSNVGVLLGEPSGGLTDVDLDCAEALALADALLPETSSSFGRAGAPRSHRLYVSPAARTVKYADPEAPPDDAMLVELRSTGAQTMGPPSVHPCGEAVAWAEVGEPATVAAEELRRHVSRLAAATLLVRAYPAQGARHEYVLAVAGVLARRLPAADAERMLLAIVRAAGDDEDRRADLRSTLRRLAAERPASGWPTLARAIGERRAARIREWLGAAPDTLLDGAAQDDGGIGDDRRGDAAAHLPVIRTLADIARDPTALEPPTVVVPRLAWRGRVTMLAAREKDGKSTLATAAAAAASGGARWLGDPTLRGSVLWVGLEEHGQERRRDEPRQGPLRRVMRRVW